VARITVTGEITEFPVPTTMSSPYGIASGPDGNVWFTEFSKNRISRIEIAPASGRHTRVVSFRDPA
jgi:virginiamycin B lyase